MSAWIERWLPRGSHLRPLDFYYDISLDCIIPLYEVMRLDPYSSLHVVAGSAVCEMWRRGENRFNKPMLTLFHTSHPGLDAALRRDPKWTQVSAALCGDNKARSAASLA